MVGISTVVTPEVRQVTNQFEDLVERRDIVGLGFIAVVGAAGVALANEVVDMVLPRAGFNPDPQTTNDFAAAGITQLLWAGLLVTFAGSVLAGSPVLFSGAIGLAIGAVVIGGAQLFEFGQRLVARFTGSAPMAGGQGAGAGTGGGSGNRSRSPRPGSGGRTPGKLSA